MISHLHLIIHTYTRSSSVLKVSSLYTDRTGCVCSGGARSVIKQTVAGDRLFIDVRQSQLQCRL